MDYRLMSERQILEFPHKRNYKEIMSKSSKTRCKNMLGVE